MAQKRCTRCGEFKDLSEFNWRYQDRGVLQSVCRDCQHLQSHEHYETHKEDVKRKARNTKQEAIERAERYVYEYLSYQICANCGQYDFAVLTFHHVRGKKKMDVMAMVAEGYSIEAIQEEIDKCEILCADCHMRAENEKRSGGRFRKYWPKFPDEE